jgi:hypothetical protein
MKRLIGVLIALPHFTFCQTWAIQDIIPINTTAYQKNNPPLMGLSELPALLGFKSKIELGVIIENKYNLKELTQLRLGIGIPVLNGNLSINSSLQGSTLFSNYAGNLSYGIQINKQTTIGIGSGILFQNIKGYGSEKVIQVVAGIAHLVNEKTMFAFHYHFNQSIEPTTSANKLKTEGLSFGIGYHLSKSVFIQLEAKKIQQQFRILPSINWSPFEKIGFWCGTNGSGHMHLGINSQLKKTKFMLGFSNHLQLGYSMLLHFNYRLNDKN